MALSMHLHSTGTGMASKTACGRSVTRTPMSAVLSDFMVSNNPCDKCKTSKLFSFLLRKHNESKQQSNEVETFSEWEAIPDSETIKADKALLMNGKQGILHRLFSK